MRTRSYLSCLSILCVLLAVTGCGSSRATLSAKGTAPLNLNSAGESTAVRVRIFPLKAEGNFRSATVETLWSKDQVKEALKDDLSGDLVEETVTPAAAGESPVSINVPYGDTTRFLGVLAMFPKADAKDNRTLLIPIDRAHGAKLILTGYSVSLSER